MIDYNQSKENAHFLHDSSEKPMMKLKYLYENIDKLIEFYPVMNANDLFSTEDKIYRKFLYTLYEYFKKHSKRPTYTTLLDVMVSDEREEFEKAMMTEFVKEVETMEVPDEEHVIELLKTDVKRSCLIKMPKICEALLQGKPDDDNFTDKLKRLNDVYKVMNNVERIFCGETKIKTPYDLMKTALARGRWTTPISTGLEKLDYCISGGLRKKGLAVVVAPSGVGKTTFLVHIANKAALAGKKVLQIFFEDDEDDIYLKHLGALTKIESNNFKNPKSPEKLEAYMNTLMNTCNFQLFSDNVRFMKLVPKHYRVRDIKDEIDRYIINSEFTPDVITLDYFDNLIFEKTTKADSDWVAQGNTLREIETLANELDCAVWVAHQMGRGGYNGDAKITDGGGSIQISQIAHVYITVEKTDEDKRNNRATVTVHKARTGLSGRKIRNIYYNNANCVISDENSYFDDGGLPGEIANVSGARNYQQTDNNMETGFSIPALKNELQQTTGANA